MITFDTNIEHQRKKCNKCVSIYKFSHKIAILLETVTKLNQVMCTSASMGNHIYIMQTNFKKMWQLCRKRISGREYYFHAFKLPVCYIFWNPGLSTKMKVLNQFNKSIRFYYHDRIILIEEETGRNKHTDTHMIFLSIQFKTIIIINSNHPTNRKLNLMFILHGMKFIAIFISFLVIIQYVHSYGILYLNKRNAFKPL